MDNIEHKGKIIGYNSKHQFYEVQYADGDKEEFYHNEIHAHQDWVKLINTEMKQKLTNNSKSLKFLQVKKEKDIRRKY